MAYSSQTCLAESREPTNPEKSVGVIGNGAAANGQPLALGEQSTKPPAGQLPHGLISLPTEPPGPSSRKTPIVISEIMYKPAPRTDTNNLEFIEIYNSNPWFHDISGYRLVGSTPIIHFQQGPS
jgi:hypothetical protein